MASTGEKLGEDLLKIPKLAVTGSNWVVYKDRLRFAADARGYLQHLEEAVAAPVMPVSHESPTAAQNRAHQEALTKWEADLARWKKGEAVMKQLIASSIPDSLFMKVRGRTTAHEIWSALGGEGLSADPIERFCTVSSPPSGKGGIASASVEILRFKSSITTLMSVFNDSSILRVSNLTHLPLHAVRFNEPTVLRSSRPFLHPSS